VPRVVVPTDPRELFEALRAALTGTLTGTGPDRLDRPVVALEPLVHDDATLPPDAALVVRTSGSTGTPREVVIPRSALLASIEATAARIGGHGRWFLALPWRHVAGAQVVARSAVAGRAPALLPGDQPFTPALFARHATEFLDDGRDGPAAPSYVSLVPTQLHRITVGARDTGGTGTGGTGGTGSSDAQARAALDALRRFDAILLGGAAAPTALLDAARTLGLRVVTTYGMSETCGGSVYDGVPLDGVHVRVDDDGEGTGRVSLGGEVVAAGYLGDPAATRDAFSTDDDGTRWFRTSDLGELATSPATAPEESSPQGVRLRVLGRADDVIVTGGEKVSPTAVEHALAALGEVCVVGVDDPEWGQAVAAVVVVAGAAGLAAAGVELREDARRLARETLGPAAAPRHVLVAPDLPLRGPGKVDRRGLADRVARVVGGSGRSG
jgi:O-succinylbenzoic acid--CoA ligase